ncbi:hypothetical protein Syn7502_00048 [Synechococcus sp. PCC 7502]|uniref:hypothetical protein n=1 Tax=Synechococcus sp. PCC 7502 TaxID=1173263 RepID=UPI00029FD92E|nr:hypothetical protein [Synechococcus sp. PCC 7502]AFY72223.1 hypothetical protein Syn7502_00048 [Synechococcus sp. PCC 7502]
MENLKTQLNNLLQKAKGIFTQLQERLPKSMPAKPVTAKPTASSPLGDRIRAELLEAVTFIQNRLLPTVLGFVAKVVDKIDPPLSSVVNKVTSNPTVINAGQKLQATSLWQKSSIALAPIWRSLTETLKPVSTSESVKPILAKPVGTFALVLVLTFLLSLRPHPVASVAVVTPIQPVQTQPKPLTELIPAESGDAPISPEKVLVSSIQAQVVDISRSYGEALIGGVQTNFRLGRLIVQLSDAWYQLSPERQEQLVTDLAERSQTLSFKKLFLVDVDQHLLARTSAIVKEGSAEMIILRR